jgi:hypothetical protein
VAVGRVEVGIGGGRVEGRIGGREDDRKGID